MRYRSLVPNSRFINTPAQSLYTRPLLVDLNNSTTPTQTEPQPPPSTHMSSKSRVTLLPVCFSEGNFQMTKPWALITSRLSTFTAESSQAVLRKSISPILIRLQASLGFRAPCLLCGEKNPFKYYSFNSFFKHKTQ